MGKLNILQHKSWHVYSEKNREKVRKDEEKARIEEEKKAERAVQADREARLDLMRSRARAKRQESDVSESNQTLTVPHHETEEPQQHVNFFPELETGRSATGKNAEHEAEKKAEKAKEDLKSTWYLGETRDGKKEVPWYATMDMKAPTRTDPLGRPVTQADEKKKEDKDDRRKHVDDPLAMMEKYVKGMKSSEKDRHKKDKSSRHKSSTSSSSSSMDRLRAERLKREADERRRTELLLNPHLAKAPTQHEKEATFYNSQFNPKLVRKPKDPEEQRRKRPWEEQDGGGRYGEGRGRRHEHPRSDRYAPY
ncbi:hypothetical protein HDV00_008018 [Rhizophlyctis rosea]|nr:hypothetical protein HDV00_008018 [Rhizophlyctis rosea]